MGDSMEEEFDSAGAIVPNCSGSFALSVPQNSMEHPTSTPTAFLTAGSGGHGLLRGPPDTWTRKRSRPGIEGGREASTCPNWAKAMSGGHVPPTRGRESPDSDMSSSGSDVSINKGIKRMRLDHHNKQQPQQQYQQQYQQQGRPPPSAFGLVSSEQGSRPSLARGAAENAAAGAIDALRRPAEAAPDAGNPRFIDNPARPIASPMPLRHSATIPEAVHHPRLVPFSERSSSNGLSSMDNTENEPIMARSASAGVLQCGVERSGPHEPSVNGGHHAGRLAHSDRCAEFSPFAPRPPAQARYVRGIRVQTDAPADVDYSNVNHALRQLHMERRMMAAARDGAEAGRQGLGQTRHSPR